MEQRVVWQGGEDGDEANKHRITYPPQPDSDNNTPDKEPQGDTL